jgi:hypothetical protein
LDLFVKMDADTNQQAEPTALGAGQEVKASWRGRLGTSDEKF